MAAANGATRTSSSVGTSAMERFLPGAIVSVGTHKVEIVNYLAEGGFAQIYVVKFIEYLNEFDNKLKKPLKVGEVACLKRVLVQDENGLREMRNEVEVMKQLMGAQNIVQYYDSNACRRHNGNSGFEVLLLMELCPNKSLLDYMNQRLATKLTEKEILKIMYDVSLAVAQMHYSKVPLIHRDIKIENVLVDADNNFKLCDFGSTSQCFPVVTTHQEIAILTQNIYVHTTPQYRCPEMIDLYRCLPINEKSDIWALGIFLFKLLFFTTPFEMTGQFAILHSKYEFPPNNYSSHLINLIIIMLAENPYVRPNIYQVLQQICATIGVEVPIEDKYGSGPYDYQKYSEFQTKLQDAQYQMYVLQQKRLENGILSPSEETMLNSLMIATFEVSAKIPLEADSRGSSKTPDLTQESVPEGFVSSNEDLVGGKSASVSEGGPTRGSSLKNVEKATDSGITGDQAVEKESHHTASVDNDQNISNDGIQKSGVGVRNQSLANEYATQNAQSQNNRHLTATEIISKQKSTTSTGGKSSTSGPQPLNSEDITEPTGKSDVVLSIKQHKSNNPFPRMAQEYGDSTKAENFFINDMSTTPQPVQANQQQYPVTEAIYAAKKDGMQQPQQPQRSQFVSQPTQQLQQQHLSNAQQNGYVYHPADFGLGAPQPQQPLTYRQAQEMAMVIPNVRYNYPNVPSNTNLPYYAVPQPGFNVSKHHDPMSRPMGLSQSQPHQVPAQLDQTVAHPVPDRAAEENPPPMPARWKGTPREGSEPLTEERKREDELLIAFSPPKNQPNVHPDSIANETSPSKVSKDAAKHESLNLTYNEMDLSQEDLSQEDLMKSDTNSIALHTGGLDSSMASSESIELNLDEAKLGGRSLRIKRAGAQGSSTASPLGRRRDFRTEEREAQQLDSDSETEIPRRRSLDLQYQEIHFSSPDLKSENAPTLLGHQRKTSGTSKQKASHSVSKKLSDPSDTSSHSASHKSRRNHESANSSGTTSRKHSTHGGSASRTTSQNKGDLEKYKAKNSSGSNSSINISSTSVSGMRRSFAKARQSLDLEKVRREALNNSEPSLNAASTGKRRSLFSVFRSDKK